jgi:hypothetical protein
MVLVLRSVPVLFCQSWDSAIRVFVFWFCCKNLVASFSSRCLLLHVLHSLILQPCIQPCMALVLRSIPVLLCQSWDSAIRVFLFWFRYKTLVALFSWICLLLPGSIVLVYSAWWLCCFDLVLFCSVVLEILQLGFAYFGLVTKPWWHPLVSSGSRKKDIHLLVSLFVWDWSGFLLFQLYIIVRVIHGNKGFVADVAVILLCFPYATSL